MRLKQGQSSSSSSSSSSFFILIFLYLYLSSCCASRLQLGKDKAVGNDERTRRRSAIFVFGDSTVDSGNNNFINTLFTSNYPPYGQDFPGNVPTGRFCNGRLVTDFIASYIGVKENVPPYLDPNLGRDELISGVSFASAGSGYDPLTASISNVIDLQSQLEYFREYKRNIELIMGKEEMQKHIEAAAFFISLGTNDFIVNYYTLPIRNKTFTVEAYQQFLINNLNHFLKGLWEEGARRIGVAGLPPMGCLPVVITVFSPEPLTNRGCIHRFSDVATQFNRFLQHELKSTQMSLAHLGSKIYYVDTFTPFFHIIHDHRRYGFDEVDRGCCGTGYVEASFLCNRKANVCPNTSSYVFFDSIHPSEKTYYNIFQAARPVVDVIIGA